MLYTDHRHTPLSCDTFRRASWPYRVMAKSPPAQLSSMLLKGQSGPQTSLREATPSSRTNKCEHGTWWASIAHRRKIANQNGAGPSSNDIRVGLRQNRSAHRMRVGSPSHPLAVRPTHYIMQTMHRNEGPRSRSISPYSSKSPTSLEGDIWRGQILLAPCR